MSVDGCELGDMIVEEYNSWNPTRKNETFEGKLLHQSFDRHKCLESREDAVGGHGGQLH